jgi:hypothetical protein
MGSFMATLMDPIRLGLQESVRKMTVRIKWNEAGKIEQVIEVVSFLTDPSRLETAVTLSANGGTGTDTKTSTSTGTKTTSSVTATSAAKK